MKITLKSKGIIPLHSTRRGDHIIFVNVKIPTDLSSVEIELLKKYAHGREEITGDGNTAQTRKAVETLAPIGSTEPRRLFLVGLPTAFPEAFAALAPADAGAAPKALIEAKALALVDQTGALRGFWPAGELGRGNLINAARLIARRGPSP